MVDDETAYQSPKRSLIERGLRPRKRLGQNFLVDARFAERVASAIPAGAFVIEIGRGTGTLTRAIAKHARMVIVLEIDRDLAKLLEERFENLSQRVLIRASDALEFDFCTALTTEPPRGICGNLPYYITTPLIEKVVGVADAWEIAVLMVQREYARRLAASAGSPDYGSLTAYVGHYCFVEKLFDVGAAGFYPPPAVASSVVRLSPRRDRLADLRDEQHLLRVIRAAFAQRRKTLANCIEARASGIRRRSEIEAAIRGAGIEPTIRGERLTREDFRTLSNSLVQAGVDIS
jgi:16S rRNA (adenine1518-N6/adenine1519-N6)-dimethyltransferase